MKKWKCLAAALVVGLVVAVYFEPTRCVRGWLWGEAFFDGRPTSYWRVRCDEWSERMQDAGSLINMTLLLPYEVPGHDGLRMWVPEDEKIPGGGISMPRETTWKRIQELFRAKEDLQRDAEFRYAPRILWGSPDAEPVLSELARDEKYRELTRLAFKRIKCLHEMKTYLDKQPNE